MIEKIAVGFVTDNMASPIHDWAFEWQAPVIKCEIFRNEYVLAYTRQFIEIWRLNDGVLLQVLLTPEFTLLSQGSETIISTLESSLEGNTMIAVPVLASDYEGDKSRNANP